MHIVIFSPSYFLCILLLEETFGQGQALQQRVTGPSLSHILAWMLECGRTHFYTCVVVGSIQFLMVVGL